MRPVKTMLVMILTVGMLGGVRSWSVDDLDLDALLAGLEEEEQAAESADPAVEETQPAPMDDLDLDAWMDDMDESEPAEPTEPAEPAAPVAEDVPDFMLEVQDEMPPEPGMESEPAPAAEPPAEEIWEPEEPAADDLDMDSFFDDFLGSEPEAETAPAITAEPFEFPDDEPAMGAESAPEPDMDAFFDDFLEAEPAPAEEMVEEPVVEFEEPAPPEPAAAEPAEPVDPKEAERLAREMAHKEEVRRQAAEVNGIKNLEDGYAALRDGRFERARGHFEVALRDIPVRPATADMRQRATYGLAESHYRIAQEIYRQDGDMRTAKQNVDRAMELSPGHRGVSFLQRRIAREQARRDEIAQLPVPPADRPDIVEKRKDVDELLSEARMFYDVEEYDRAESLYDAVLARDEFNVEAMRYLRKIAEVKYKRSTREREATTAQMIQQVRDAWNPPKRDVDVARRDDLLTGQTDLVTPARVLQQKMERIIIPRIEFRQANIRDVVNFLVEASREADPDKEGVNIILNLSVPEGARMATPAPAPQAADPWDDWDQPLTAAPADSGVGPIPTITLNLRRISLMEAIRYITEVAGLKFRVEESAVIITPAGIVTGRVVTRLYPVQPSFQDIIAERSEEAAAPAGGFGTTGEFGGFGERRPAVRRSDVKDFFERAGVPFPVGTSISYNASISRLIVANTPENLDVFERILSQLNVVPSQVEIEARFVEVAQEDLRELGLQWILTDHYEFLQKKGGGPIGGTERIQVNAGPKGFTRGNRYFGASDSETGVDPLSTALTVAPTFAGDILSISSVLTNPELTMVLHALAQNGNTDLLSAPRITTRSGVNASIEVVTEIIYPTEFRVTEPTITAASGASGSAVISPPTVTPDSFETRRTGVILNVTPTVGPDGFTIDLALAPEVAELVDWLQYGSVLRVPNPEEPGTFQEFVYNIPQPVFASRNVTTSIVIWDGQTVVMGGLMRERLITINDKIPILGDIPVLGRLFRTEGSQSRKENLIIFVTARLVGPDGKPLHRADAVSMPGVIDQ